MIAALLLPLVCPAHAGTYSLPAFSGGQWFSSDWNPGLPHFYEGSGNTWGTGDSSMQVNSYGPLSAAFTWSSANNPADPAPPCILMQNSYAEWDLDFPSNPTASCSDGLGDLEVDTYNGQTFRGLSTGTRYSVGVPNSSGVISQSLTGAQSQINPGVEYGTFGSSVMWTVTAYPIALTSPNPLGRPDQGDGTNQFVYDATTPKGYLILPGVVTIPGATSDATAWIMRDPKATASHVTLTADLPAESVLHDGVLMDHALVSSIPVDSLVAKYGSLPNPSDGFQYLGLPNANSGFGNHLVTMTVDNNPSQQAHIQTFFSRDASNWPTSDGTTPNWFHYWSMTSANFGNPVYVSGSRSQTVYDPVSQAWVAHIEDDMVGSAIPSYENATGIDAFAWGCRHEAQHVENSTAWYGTTPRPGTSTPYDPSMDLDGDFIPDALEPALGRQYHPELANGYSPDEALTAGVNDDFKYGSGFNDNEDYTQRRQRENHPWTNGSADTEDWSSPGHQYRH